MALTCEPFTGSPAAWDGFVRAVPGWTHFHLHGWKDVVERTLGHRTWYLGAFDDQRQLQGVLPLVEVRSPLFGHYLVSMPFINYGGPLGSPDAVRRLVDEATRLATERGADLLELRSRTELDVGLTTSGRKITVLLDLPRGKSEPLWASFDPKLRSQIRKPGKEGVVMKFGSAELEPFYEVFARHMRDLGTPVQGRPYFEAMAAAFPDDMWLGCAYLKGKAIAAGCGFRWGSEFEMTWASALYDFNRLAPNMLLYWAFIEKCIEAGVDVFNFGRCTPGSGTHRFKRQWGNSRDQQLWWYQHQRGGNCIYAVPKRPTVQLGPQTVENAAPGHREPTGAENRSTHPLMLMLRRQLPAYSPVSLGALVHGYVAWMGLGQSLPVRDLEDSLRRDYGSRAVLLTDSGTTALSLAIATALESRPGRVALPAYCCYDVATAALGAGAGVVLYDIDPTTLGPDFDSFDRALDGGATAAVVAHLFGVPADIPRAQRSCGARGAVLIEDAAQGTGGRFEKRLLGSQASLGILSFGRGKGMTGGAGGALLAGDERGAQLLRAAGARVGPAASGKSLLALTGQWLLGRPSVYGIPAALPFLRLGETVFRSPQAWRGISPAAARVVSDTTAMAAAECEVRREIAGRLARSITTSGSLEPVRVLPNAEPGYLRLPVIASEGARRSLRTAAAARLGIMPGYPRTLSTLEGFRECCDPSDPVVPGAQRLADSLFTIPTHSFLLERDIVALESLLCTA